MPDERDEQVLASRLAARFDKSEVVVLMRDREGQITSSVSGVNHAEMIVLLAAALHASASQAALTMPRMPKAESGITEEARKLQ